MSDIHLEGNNRTQKWCLAGGGGAEIVISSIREDHHVLILHHKFISIDVSEDLNLQLNDII